MEHAVQANAHVMVRQTTNTVTEIETERERGRQGNAETDNDNKCTGKEENEQQSAIAIDPYRGGKYIVAGRGNTNTGSSDVLLRRANTHLLQGLMHMATAPYSTTLTLTSPAATATVTASQP
jgi:hypothetical protein